MIYDVSLVPCSDYSEESVKIALAAVLEPIGGLDWVQKGMTIAIKANLVTFLKPETGAVTHPSLVKELCRLLTEKGAKVIVGDSPGGPWNHALVSAVYNATGMKTVESVGAALNKDFSQRTVEFPEAKMAKSFPFTSWLDEADFIIDFCKLKTHGLTAMSCAVKNLFGVVPGTRKPEFHYLFPQVDDFANMLVDLNEFVKPKLTIVDAITTMEGNGPTQGTPRHMGALIASHTPYNADLVCCELIGLTPQDVPTIKASINRGLCPESKDKLNVYGNPDKFTIPDFKKQPIRDTLKFGTKSPLISAFLEHSFGSGPRVIKEKCVGCRECERMCPRKTITINKGKAEIRKGDCIRCFCCQEFCPKGAIIVHRPILARVLGKNKEIKQ